MTNIGKTSIRFGVQLELQWRYISPVYLFPIPTSEILLFGASRRLVGIMPPEIYGLRSGGLSTHWWPSARRWNASVVVQSASISRDQTQPLVAYALRDMLDTNSTELPPRMVGPAEKRRVYTQPPQALENEQVVSFSFWSCFGMKTVCQTYSEAKIYQKQWWPLPSSSDSIGFSREDVGSTRYHRSMLQQ